MMFLGLGANSLKPLSLSTYDGYSSSLGKAYHTKKSEFSQKVYGSEVLWYAVW